MSETPQTPDSRQQLSRAAIAGAVLAVVGIVLFLVLYTALGGMDALPRLLISLCVPPAVMACVVGLFLLFTARRSDTE